MSEDKVKLYAFSVVLDVGNGAIRPVVGYITGRNEDEATGKAYEATTEQHDLPVMRISVCHIPTEDIVTCSCQDEHDLEEHF